MTEKQSNELLNRACDLITSLEMFIGYDNADYRNSDLSKNVDSLFNEVDMLNFHPHEDTGPEHDSAGFTEEDRIVDGQYRTYVENVKRSIDKATEEGILRDDDSEGYSYLSKEEFIKRLEVDPRFVEMGDPNWLFPGEPFHDDYYYDPEDKLEIVKTNISDLVTWLDKNNKMSTIPDEIWKYIINIEKVVGISHEYTDPDAEAQDYDTFGKNKI
jgi:hypothetical protein